MNLRNVLIGGCIIGCAITVTLAAYHVGAVNRKASVTNNANVQYEFVCESDGELSERHVGVYKAVPAFKLGAGLHSESWQIIYVDGAVAYYKQVPGETCQVIGIEVPTDKRGV